MLEPADSNPKVSLPQLQIVEIVAKVVMLRAAMLSRLRGSFDCEDRTALASFTAGRLTIPDEHHGSRGLDFGSGLEPVRLAPRRDVVRIIKHSPTGLDEFRAETRDSPILSSASRHSH